MKFKNLFTASLVLSLAVSAGFTGCKEDDDNSSSAGNSSSKVSKYTYDDGDEDQRSFSFKYDSKQKIKSIDCDYESFGESLSNLTVTIAPSLEISYHYSDHDDQSNYTICNPEYNESGCITSISGYEDGENSEEQNIKISYNADNQMNKVAYVIYDSDKKEVYRETNMYTWQDGNITKVQYEHASQTITYTDIKNNGIFLNYSELDILDFMTVPLALSGYLGVPTKNLPASAVYESDDYNETLTFDYKFDGKGRVTEVMTTITSDGDSEIVKETFSY